MLNMSIRSRRITDDRTLSDLIHQNYENYQMPDTQLGQSDECRGVYVFSGGKYVEHVDGGCSVDGDTSKHSDGDWGAEPRRKRYRCSGVLASNPCAAKDVAGWYQKGKKWEDADVRDLMEQASYEIDRTTGTMEEVISKESMALINSARMGKGLTPINLGGLFGNPLTHYMGLMRKLYQIPAGLNNRIALVAGYKLARERGLGHQAAVEDAKRVSYLANFNEGKAGRPIAPFSNKGAIGRTAAQMMFSLQAYNHGGGFHVCSAGDDGVLEKN